MGQITVRVTPRSSQEKIEVESGVIRIWVKAAPTDGEANRAVLKLLAKALGVAPSTLTIVRGESSRDKVIASDLDADVALFRLSK